MSNGVFEMLESFYHDEKQNIIAFNAIINIFIQVEKYVYENCNGNMPKETMESFASLKQGLEEKIKKSQEIIYRFEHPNI